jgi:hypothetical protein
MGTRPTAVAPTRAAAGTARASGATPPWRAP